LNLLPLPCAGSALPVSYAPGKLKWIRAVRYSIVRGDCETRAYQLAAPLGHRWQSRSAGRGRRGARGRDRTLRLPVIRLRPRTFRERVQIQSSPLFQGKNARRLAPRRLPRHFPQHPSAGATDHAQAKAREHPVPKRCCFRIDCSGGTAPAIADSRWRSGCSVPRSARSGNHRRGSPINRAARYLRRALRSIEQD
jgi:hypothetical protein